MDELTEMIADAKAEEEVRREQIEKRIEKPAERVQTVTIPLDEYNGLRDSYNEFNLVMNAIMSGLEDSPIRTRFTTEGEARLITLLSLLYPNAREWI